MVKDDVLSRHSAYCQAAAGPYPAALCRTTASATYHLLRCPFQEHQLVLIGSRREKNAINKTAQDEPAGTDMGAVGSTHILKFYYFSFSEVLEYNLELPLLFKVHLKIISLHSKLSEL